MSKSNRDKLIAAIYSTALYPDEHQSTIDKIDNIIFGDQLDQQEKNSLIYSDVSNTLNEPSLDPDLLMHFNMAHNIQLKVGRKKREKPKLLTLLEEAPNPAYIFNFNEKIIAINGHAKEAFGNICVKLADCCKNDDLLGKIREFSLTAKNEELLILPGYINSKQNTNTCILVKKIREKHDKNCLVNEIIGEDIFFVTVVSFSFDQGKTELFKETYNLTDSETAIAIHLASGMQIPEIAEIRNSMPATIRTHIKSLKRKTDVRDIPAVVRLLCGFSAGILASLQLSNNTSSTVSKHLPNEKKGEIILRDKRRMAYIEQGNLAGTPVLMIHNMPYGVKLPAKAVEAANRLNLRIIAPYRPGYGDSDINQNAHGTTLLSEVATDFCELLDKLKIDHVKVVGQTIGALYALRFAKMFPDRVSKLFAISRAPIWRDQWIKKMPKRQRFSLRITKYIPQLLPTIMHSTVLFIDKGHGEKLVHYLCKDSPVDRDVLNHTPEICDLMVEGCEEGLKQGVDAFCRDCVLAIQDFSEEAQTLSHSFHILHGDADKIVDISQSEAFANSVQGTQLEIIKGAGQLLYYSHWDRVLKAIKTK